MPTFRFNDLVVTLSPGTADVPCPLHTICVYSGCGPRSVCRQSICVLLTCGHSLACGVASCGILSECRVSACGASCLAGSCGLSPLCGISRDPQRDPRVELAALKEELRQALTEVERLEQVTAQAQLPQTPEQAEEVERKLTAALEQVRARKEELRRKQK